MRFAESDSINLSRTQQHGLTCWLAMEMDRDGRKLSLLDGTGSHSCELAIMHQ
jgi:hypothetical protein